MDQPVAQSRRRRGCSGRCSSLKKHTPVDNPHLGRVVYVEFERLHEISGKAVLFCCAEKQYGWQESQDVKEIQKLAEIVRSGTSFMNYWSLEFKAPSLAKPPAPDRYS